MSTHQPHLPSLPLPLLHNISSYLSVSEINSLASTCSDLKNVLFVQVKAVKCDKAKKASGSSNELYSGFNILRLKSQVDAGYRLNFIRISVSTKDQGFVLSKKSNSWVEASYSLGQTEDSKQLSYKNSRFPLFQNYEVPRYRNKICFIEDRDLLENLNELELFLRSDHRDAQIFCREAEVALFYTRQDREPLVPKQAMNCAEAMGEPRKKRKPLVPEQVRHSPRMSECVAAW